MTALESSVKLTVLVPVEINADVDDVLDLSRSLGNEHLYGVGIVLEAACDKGIVGVESSVVVVNRLVDSCHAALCQSGIAEVKLSLADDKYIHSFGQAEGCVKSAHTCACNNDVIMLFHKDLPSAEIPAIIFDKIIPHSPIFFNCILHVYFHAL